MAYFQLRSRGLVCREVDIHHLVWLMVDTQRGNPARSPVLTNIFATEVFPFLAFPLEWSVTAGCSHTCTLTAAGQLVCFGSNLFGQCDVPAGLGAVTSVAAGACHTCALTAEGQLVCFGAVEPEVPEHG